MKTIKSILSMILILILTTSPLFAARVNEKAPDFVLKDLGDKPFSLSDFKGQNVLLFFWASWCPYCLAEINKLMSRCNEFRSHGVTILAINVKERSGKVKRFLENKQICFNTLLDQKASVAFSYDLMGVPAFFIIDRDGTIKYADTSVPKDLGPYLND